MLQFNFTGKERTVDYRGLSRNQRLLADFLLQRIGFDVDPFVEQYLSQFYQYSHIDGYTREPVYLNRAIEVLKREINLRQNIRAYYKSQRNNVISASDIENFTFCPVAFSITSTFAVPANSLGDAGTALHERETLNLSFRKIGSEYGVGSYFRTDELITKRPDLSRHFSGDDRGMLKDIENSDLLFSDGAGPNDQMFKSKNGKFIGRPDYIFRNRSTGSVYVVEEKFSLLSSRRVTDSNRFYKNHINQTRSYIYGISEFDVAYAYLVYWRYQYYDERPFISAAACSKIERSEQARNELVKVYRAIQKVRYSGSGTFYPEYRHPTKCANCGVAVFCGHKTGKIESFNFPYAEEHVLPKKVPFPETLMKSSRVEVITFENRTYTLKDRLFKQYCQSFVATLNAVDRTFDYTRYNAEWDVRDGKLYLQKFTFFGTKMEDGRREVIWEYPDHMGEAHLITFISATIVAYYEKEQTDDTVEIKFEELCLDIKNGLVSLYKETR